MDNKFRLKGKRLFLTYPQCAIEPAEALTQLKDKCIQMKRKLGDYIIAQEEHKEEGLHLHCYIEVDKPVDTLNARCYDLSLNDVVFHGNYQGVKSDEHVIKYVTKDGNFISSKDISELLAKHECRVGKKKVIGKELLGLKDT